MFYWGNFGRFGENLPTDLDGFVPEHGDQPEELRWPAGTEWTRDEWEAFVADAVLKTDRARCQLAQWRDPEHSCLLCLREWEGEEGE